MIAFGYFLTLYKNTVNTYNISIHVHQINIAFSNSHITDTSRKLDTTQS